MTQTTWEDEFDKRFNKDTLVSAHTDWTPKAIKDFISKTISQEKEKWLQIIETKREECKKYPLKSTNGSIKNKTANDMVDVALLDIINLLQNK